MNPGRKLLEREALLSFRCPWKWLYCATILRSVKASKCYSTSGSEMVTVRCVISSRYELTFLRLEGLMCEFHMEIRKVKALSIYAWSNADWSGTFYAEESSNISPKTKTWRSQCSALRNDTVCSTGPFHSSFSASCSFGGPKFKTELKSWWHHHAEVSYGERMHLD